jgi:predicted short-subunit dehydrogenase-like oxidoreductase (DUF2520 family)
VDDNRDAARYGRWIILTVPDDEVEQVTAELASSDVEWKDKFVFHCSGLLSSESLIPLEKKGAWTASIHPVQSFPRKKPKSHAFQDIYFSLEGKKNSLELAKKIVRQLDGKHFFIDAKNKPLYHTACSMASNFLVTLLDTAIELLEQAGLTKSEASQVLFPLVQGTLQSVKKFDASSALTGPIVRGDERSIAQHIQALQKFPQLRGLYLEIADRSLQIAKREKKLPAEKIKAIEALLGER